jgi:hypothetical protein
MSNLRESLAFLTRNDQLWNSHLDLKDRIHYRGPQMANWWR